MFIVIFHIMGYRRKVVSSNLKNSFPERSEDELKIIEREFYRHFCDIVVESIKAFTISLAQLNRMVQYDNLEIFTDDYERGRDCVSYSGHYGNWELPSMNLPQHTPYSAAGIMARIKNKVINDKVRKSRARFGSMPLFTNDLKTIFNGPNPVNLVFFADQSPHSARTSYWSRFLNQDTAFYMGAEKTAVKNNIPIYLMYSDKIKRGRYMVYSKKLIDDPSIYKEGEITEIYIRELEKIILEKPHIWLWTHRRWKHKRPSDVNISKPIEEKTPETST